MNEKTPWIIAAVASVIAAVALAVIVASAMDDDHMNGANNGYMGMMQGMGRMDSAGMLAGMRSVLGDEEYEQMLAHMASHRSGGPMIDSDQTDGMMHRMMDGMMQQMPFDRDDLMPGPR